MLAGVLFSQIYKTIFEKERILPYNTFTADERPTVCELILQPSAAIRCPPFCQRKRTLYLKKRSAYKRLPAVILCQPSKYAGILTVKNNVSYLSASNEGSIQ